MNQREAKAHRRKLLEGYLAANPFPTMKHLLDFYKEVGIDVKSGAVYQDLTWARETLHERAAIVQKEVYGIVVNGLIHSFESCRIEGKHQTATGVARELNNILHLDEVNPSRKLLAMEAKVKALEEANKVMDTLPTKDMLELIAAEAEKEKCECKPKK